MSPRPSALSTCLVGALLATGTTAHADATEADRLFEEGRALMAAKKPAEACAKFEASIKLDPEAAGTMLNLGLCYEQTSRPASALVWFRRGQARASETGLTSQEQAAKEHTKALARIVPVVTITFAGAPPAGVRVTLDGTDVPATDWARVEADPGRHVVAVTAPDKAPWRRAVEVQAAGATAVTVGALGARVDPNVAKRRALWLTSVGGGAWLLSLGYDLLEKRHYDNAKEAGDTKAANASGKRVRYIGTSVGVVSALVAAYGLYSYFTADTSESPEAAARTAVVPAIGPDQLGLAITGGF